MADIRIRSLLSDFSRDPALMDSLIGRPKNLGLELGLDEADIQALEAASPLVPKKRRGSYPITFKTGSTITHFAE